MTRLFLTLLALFAGVSVQLAPAQARARPVDASEINCIGPLAEENSTAEASQSPQDPVLACRGRESPHALASAVIRIPAVRLRIDRAHE